MSTPLWEVRWHPLREEWVLFCAQRGGRPWVGDTHDTQPTQPALHYDPTCALCPGNARVQGRNPQYSGVYWFANDLPPFSEEAPEPQNSDDFYRARAAKGAAEVVCYSPDHAKTFADLSDEEARAVVALWAERYRVLGARADVDHVLIFENKGALVGTSNPHPHGQIYVSHLIYETIARETRSARKFFETTGKFLGQEILQREEHGSRVVCQNDDFIACVPWFARYAYEVFVLPRRQIASLSELRAAEYSTLGNIIREVAIRYDNLWRLPMPYVMALHNAPTDAPHPYFPFHIEFHPPLRKPDTLKYLAGPEIGGGSMTNESDPNQKAAELRAVSPIHYSRT